MKTAAEGGSDYDLLRQAVALLPDSGGIVFDPDFRVLEAFGEAIVQRGFDPEQIVGLSLGELFPDESTETLETALRRAFDGISSGLEARSNDGSAWYRFDARPIVEDGGVVAVLGFATDITDRKRAEDQVAEEREFFEDVLDSISHLVSVKGTDRKVLHVNRCFEDFTGIRRGDAIGKSIYEFFPSAIGRRLRQDDNEVLKRDEAVRVERQLPAADGSTGNLLTERAPLRRADGSTYGIVTVGVDISERLAAERSLADARTLFETAFTDAPNGMALVALNGRFLRVNPAMSELTGYSEAELTSLRVKDIAHPDDMDEQVDLIRRALDGEFDSYSLEKRFTRKTGETVWLMLAVSLVRGESGEAPYVVAQTTNISERKQVEVDLRSEAGHDPLTGVANRRQLESALADVLKECQTSDVSASLLLLDFDEFKEINDRHGHAVGDELLRFAAGELSNRIRSTDLVARLGGDEFVLLMRGLGSLQTEVKAADLMDHFDHVAFDPEGLNIRCRASVGGARISRETTSAEAALEEADRAMYEAKRDRKPD